MSTAPPHERDWLLVSSGAQRLLLSAQHALGKSQQRSRELLRILPGQTAKLARTMSALPCRMNDIGIVLARFGRNAVGRIAHLVARSGRALTAHPAAILTVSALLIPIGYVLYCILTVPAAGGLVVEPTPSALVVQARDGQVFATRGVFKGDKLSPQELPDVLAKAIVAIEDRHFYEHGGFYIPSLMRAAYRNMLSGATREGGSTITQQLARMTYLTPERTVRRKVQEAILTLWLEQKLSKQEILSRYLNTAYFGAGVYGVDAAAKRYFGKTAKEISLAEAAMLAGLVRAPSALSPNRNLDGARQRAGLVLDAMVETGAVSAEEADTARRQPAALRIPPDSPPGANYFVDMLGNDAKRLVGSFSADLSVRSTLDLKLQAIAESVIARRLAAEGGKKNATQAALVALAPDGAVLALVGGRDYNESQFNRAAQARRQAGSLFKLFVYLAGLEKGLSPDTVALDAPVRVGDWEPENYSGRYHGQVTLRTAFAQSLNSVAVQVAQVVGINAVIETAKRLGVQSALPPVPSLALGSAEVSLLEMTRAFAAIAANAESVEPYLVESVEQGGQTIFAHERVPLQPTRNQAARAALRDLLASVVREGTGRAARLPIPAAGKTGTTQENRDAWFIGFTSDLVVGVWVGNDDNSPMRNVVGGDLPARIWSDFVTQSLAARSKVARSQTETVGLAPTYKQMVGSDANRTAVRGVARVQSTGILEIEGRAVRLVGVEGTTGRSARDFRRYLGRREVACDLVGASDEYQCRVGDQDLSRVVLFNGGGRAAANASAELRRMEALARSMRAGIWGNGDDDDD
jgi:1A family penicillin-binding protein